MNNYDIIHKVCAAYRSLISCNKITDTSFKDYLRARLDYAKDFVINNKILDDSNSRQFELELGYYNKVLANYNSPQVALN